MKANGIPICVATSSKRTAFKVKSSENGLLFDLFDGNIVCGDEVSNGKPAPDLFLAAASRLGMDPKDCLVFEDAPSGVEAAVNAGMQVIWIPDVNLDRDEKHEAMSARILTSMEHFEPGDFGLPVYSK